MMTEDKYSSRQMTLIDLARALGAAGRARAGRLVRRRGQMVVGAGAGGMGHGPWARALRPDTRARIWPLMSSLWTRSLGERLAALKELQICSQLNWMPVTHICDPFKSRFKLATIFSSCSSGWLLMHHQDEWCVCVHQECVCVLLAGAGRRKWRLSRPDEMGSQAQKGRAREMENRFSIGGGISKFILCILFRHPNSPGATLLAGGSPSASRWSRAPVDRGSWALLALALALLARARLARRHRRKQCRPGAGRTAPRRANTPRHDT